MPTFFNIIWLERLCQRTVGSKLHDRGLRSSISIRDPSNTGLTSLQEMNSTARTAPIPFLRPGDWRHKCIMCILFEGKVYTVYFQSHIQNTCSYLALTSASDSKTIRVCRQVGLETYWNQSGLSPLGTHGNIVNKMHGPLAITASTGIVTGQSSWTWHKHIVQVL